MFIVFLVVVFLILVLLYVRKRQTFWKNHGLPCTSPGLLFGDIRESVLGRKHLSFITDEIYKKFPNERFVGFYEFSTSNLLIRDLKLIESILVKDFSSFSDRAWLDPSEKSWSSKHLFVTRGKEWKDLRTKLVTPFSTNKLKLMLSLMDGCAQIMDSLIREKCEEEAVDIEEIITRFTTDVMGCCVLGLQFNTLTDSESEYRKMGKTVNMPTLKSVTVDFLRIISPKLVALLKLNENSPEVENFFHNLLNQTEDVRRKESFRRTDLMQLILDIRDQEKGQSKKNGDYEVINDEVVLSNLFIFYLVGFETTAASLGFCLYELALHPEYQQRLREEVEAVFRANKNVVSYDDLAKMTYAEMVISETLRKHTPVGTFNRRCTVPYKLPDSSFQLAPGQRITIPVRSLHFDEKFYPNPDKFDPERFTPENIATRPPFTYLPFGDGPRMCLAMRFAKMEMKLCLARIISKYEFSTCAKTEIPLQIHPRLLVLNTKNAIQLRVRRLTKD